MAYSLEHALHHILEHLFLVVAVLASRLSLFGSIGSGALTSECVISASAPVAPVPTTSVEASASVTATASRPCSSTRTSSHISEESVGSTILFDIGFGVLHVLIDDSENSLWCLPCLRDLQECMFMSSSLLANRAVVEVLADAALVSDTSNWSNAAAVTFNSFVHNSCCLCGSRVDLF